jgi:hypothetical protein
MNQDSNRISSSEQESEQLHQLPQLLRRNLLQKSFGVMAGMGLMGALTGQARALTAAPAHVTAYFNTSPGTGAIQIPGTGDIKVLNYALALEDLESSLYSQAVARLTTGGTSGTGTQFAGLGVTSGDDLSALNEFAQVEADHAAFLRNAITTAGGPVIPIFEYDFALENLTRQQVVALVYTAELTGVTAYTGAVPFFSSPQSMYVPIAAAILGTEARHTAVLAAILDYQLSVSPAISTAPLYTENNGRDVPLSPDQVLNAGGQTAPSVTYPAGGQLNPVSGPNGFIYTTSPS